MHLPGKAPPMNIPRLCLLVATMLFVSIAFVNAQSQEEPYYSEMLIFDDIPGYPSHHGSTIEALSDGSLLAAWYSGAHEKAEDVAIFGSRLLPGADAWTTPEILHDTPDRSEGNPVLFEMPDHVLWLFFVTIEGDSWNDCPIYAKTSTDHGQTWGEPFYIREEKKWMTRNKPIVLSDDRILLPLYDESLFQCHFMISDDNGATWNKWGMIKQFQSLQPTVIERDNGDLYCMMRNAASQEIWESLSRNKGETWKNARLSSLPNPGSAVDMVQLANGHIALAFNNSYERRNPLSIALSEDEGRTWSYIRNVEADDSGSYSYPAIIQDSDGIIHLTYTYRRASIKHVAFNEAWIKQGTEKPAVKSK